MDDKKIKPKSETRKRNQYCFVRLSATENDLLDLLSAEAGLKRASYLRKMALGSAGVRAQKQPKPHDRAMAQVTGQLGKIGGNLTQLNNLLREAHIHGLSNALAQDIKIELEQIKEPISDMRAAWLEAIGKEI